MISNIFKTVICVFLFCLYIYFFLIIQNRHQFYFLYINLDLNFSIFVGQNFIVQVVVPRRQIPTSILGSLYIFLHFSLLDKKHLGSRETHVFRLVENGRCIDRRVTDVTTSKFKGCYRATAIYTLKKKKKIKQEIQKPVAVNSCGWNKYCCTPIFFFF